MSQSTTTKLLIRFCLFSFSFFFHFWQFFCLFTTLVQAEIYQQLIKWTAVKRCTHINIAQLLSPNDFANCHQHFWACVLGDDCWMDCYLVQTLRLCSDYRQICLNLKRIVHSRKWSDWICVPRRHQPICMCCFGNDVGLGRFAGDAALSFPASPVERASPQTVNRRFISASVHGLLLCVNIELLWNIPLDLTVLLCVTLHVSL